MTEIETYRARAFQLMEEALALLDRSDCKRAAINLDAAIYAMPAMADGAARVRQLQSRHYTFDESSEADALPGIPDLLT